MFLPPAVLVPTGRNRDVLDLAQSVGEVGNAYIKEKVSPILSDIRDRMTHTTHQDGTKYYRGFFGSSEEAYTQLVQEVEAVPVMLSSQIGLAQSLADADKTLHAPSLEVHRTINQMANRMPWLAPQLVHLRHALSQQAIEDNVAIPAARQIGLG